MGVVNSEVVGEETQLEVGEGISPAQEGNLERAMGFEPTASCLGSIMFGGESLIAPLAF
jgi:hypothetical protein